MPVLAIIIMILSPSTLMAYSRLSMGASFSQMAMQGTIGGDELGMLDAKSSGFGIHIEGEYVPISQLSLFLRADVNPFWPKIEGNGIDLPFGEDAMFPYSLTGSFSMGIAWQMPLSDWARADIPLDLSLGLGCVVDLMHLEYETPFMSYDASEISLGAGLYAAASVYFGPNLGLSLSAMPHLTMMDYAAKGITATGGSEGKSSQLTFTSLMFSWDIALTGTVRFGW